MDMFSEPETAILDKSQETKDRQKEVNKHPSFPKKRKTDSRNVKQINFMLVSSQYWLLSR